MWKQHISYTSARSVDFHLMTLILRKKEKNISACTGHFFSCNVYNILGKCYNMKRLDFYMVIVTSKFKNTEASILLMHTFWVNIPFMPCKRDKWARVKKTYFINLIPGLELP